MKPTYHTLKLICDDLDELYETERTRRPELAFAINAAKLAVVQAMKQA